MSINKDLQQRMAELPAELEPSRDLWPGIERAIRQQQWQQQKQTRSTLWPGLALAASVCVVSVIGWFSWQQVSVAEPNWIAQVEQQKQALLVAYQDVPAVTDNWQAQLTELEHAAQSVRDALAKDPNNTVLLAMLQRIYQQQLDLINQVHQPKWQQL